MHAGYIRMLENRGVIGIFMRADSMQMVDDIIEHLFSSDKPEVVEIAEQLERDLEQYQ